MVYRSRHRYTRRTLMKIVKENDSDIAFSKLNRTKGSEKSRQVAFQSFVSINSLYNIQEFLHSLDFLDRLRPCHDDDIDAFAIDRVVYISVHAEAVEMVINLFRLIGTAHHYDITVLFEIWVEIVYCFQNSFHGIRGEGDFSDDGIELLSRELNLACISDIVLRSI